MTGQRDAAPVVGAELDQLPGSAIARFDPELRFLMVRGSVLSGAGLQPRLLEGRSAAEVLPPKQWAVVEPLFTAALAGKTVSREVGSADGAERFYIRVAPVVGSSAQVVGGVAIVTDISDQHRAMRDLAAQAEQVGVAMQAAGPMAIVGANHEFVRVNPALCRMLGYDADWLLRHGVVDVLYPPDEASYRRVVEQISAGSGDPMTVELRLLDSNGDIVWVDHTVGRLPGRGGDRGRACVAQFVDVTMLREDREALQFRATHDPLTGLMTRNEFQARTDRIASHSPRTGTELAVLFIDVDGLKPVNDRHGHAAGDKLLIEIAQRIASQLRGDDIVARVGGDEFLVAVPAIHTAADAVAIAAKIHQAIAAPIAINGEAVAVTVSIGVALAQAHDDLDITVQHADRALYGAKDTGLGRTAIYRPNEPGD